jgi:hypothetical protein
LESFKRFPGWNDVGAVYAVITVFIYGWTLYWFIWNIPSWIYYLDLKELSLILAYSLAVNLLESLFLLLIVLGLFFIFPKKWLGDGTFAFFGGILSILTVTLSYLFISYTESQEIFSSGLLLKYVAGYLMIITASILLSKVIMVSKLISVFADQAKIFLYLTLPFSAASLLVVLVRLFIL